MEDYIFIIIAIVLSALGAINNKKKKRMAQMEKDEPTENDQASFFESQFSDSFFDDDLDADPFVNSSVEPITVTKVEPEPIPTRESVSKKAENQKARELEHEEPEEITALGEIMKDFSLKKAVIYNEILERKY